MGTAAVKGTADYCFEALPKVSRTFALSISQLKEPLRTEVCVAYLVCRILDTIEDSPALPFQAKEKAIKAFLETLLTGRTPDPLFFGKLAATLGEGSSRDDRDLVLNGASVSGVFRSFPEATRKAVLPWAEEMGKGMLIYCDRKRRSGRLIQIRTLEELDDYCYYIAGTVGYMLTGLFVRNCPGIDGGAAKVLKARANDFGLALQKVNILKDIRDDHERGWCFIPSKLLKDSGLTADDLVDESRGEEVLRALAPLLEGLGSNFDRAFEYLTLIPEEEKEIRLFLSTSLYFAAATIGLMVKKRRDFLSEKKLKISRLQVAAILAQLKSRCGDNGRLEKAWEKMNSEFRDYLDRSPAGKKKH